MIVALLSDIVADQAPIPVVPVAVGPGTYWTIAGSIATTLSAAIPLFLFVRKTARNWIADVANVKAFLVTPNGRALGAVVQETAESLAETNARLLSNTAKLDSMASSVNDLHKRADTADRRLDDHVRDPHAHRQSRRWV